MLTVGIFYTCLTLYQQHTPEPSLTVGLRFTPALLDNIEQTHGLSTRQRFVDWQELIEQGKNATELEKLRLSNDFFNQTSLFVDDKVLWKAQDYWATPFEFIIKGAGDCEDFSIAKYFTLLEMGVDDSKLRITYVKALELNQAHMVLTYYESPAAVPLVLDNIKPDIRSADERRDLEPVYSFNGSGLWLAKLRSIDLNLGTAGSINAWEDLKLRMLEMNL
nr:transglutaminase-like cysteine peptidase [Methylomonas sp. SURF-2]